MSFQLILNPLFIQVHPSATPGLMKQHAKNEAGPHLGIINFMKLFLAIGPILYPLKTPEAFWFPSVFRGYEMGTLARNGSI